jgi:transcriptional regulator with XRE-family HTH domain
MATFGERLRELREKANMTQEQLAHASGVPLPSLRNYEQLHRDPYWFVVPELTVALGVDCRAFDGCTPNHVGKEYEQPAKHDKGKKSGRNK